MRDNVMESRPTQPFPAAEYAGRLRRLDRAMRAAKLDAFLVMTEVNRYYFTGMPCSNAILVVRPGARPEFCTDFRYTESARTGVPFADVRPIKKSEKAIQARGKKEGWKRVGYEGAIPAARFLELQEKLKGLVLVDGTAQLDALRRVKTPREIAVLRRAASVLDRVFAAALDEVRPGMSEWQIRALIRHKADVFAQGESFDCIVGVGENSSRCHHTPGDRILGNNEALLIDMGVMVQGYCSDMTRTVFFGTPPVRFRRIYETVLRANRSAIKALKPGAISGTVDAAARGIIRKAGHAKHFGHGLGHGVGLEVHDKGRLADKTTEKIAAGMVLTVEPGIYLPGFGGVRIEDMVLVTRTGREVLTATPKRLVCR